MKKRALSIGVAILHVFLCPWINVKSMDGLQGCLAEYLDKVPFQVSRQNYPIIVHIKTSRNITSILMRIENLCYKICSGRWTVKTDMILVLVSLVLKHLSFDEKVINIRTRTGR